MKINLYKLVIFIGIFSINYNFGMESLDLNYNQKERDSFNFFINSLSDIIYKIDKKNKFEKVEVEKIENISFYKVALDKKNEKFVYIPKFGESLNIEKFSNKQIFEIYKGFTILANDNEVLKINEEDRSEIFKYLLSNNINSLDKDIKINKNIVINFRANNSGNIYIKGISQSVRNLFIELNLEILLSKRKSLEDRISFISSNLKIVDRALLERIGSELKRMKNCGTDNTIEYKKLFDSYKEIVNNFNKLNEEGRFFKEELEFNKKIVSIKGKDYSYNELEKYQKEVVFTNSEEGQKLLKNQDQEIKAEIIKNNKKKLEEQLAIEYNEGQSEINNQSDNLLQQMINDERNKELIQKGDKLAIFENEFNKFNKNNLDNDEEIDFEAILKQEKEKKALEDAEKKTNELKKIGNIKKSKK